MLGFTIKRVLVPTLLVSALASASDVHAGGQFVGDSGPVATARGGAVVASSSGPTALIHNPAGLALASDMQLTLSANLVQMNQEFRRAGVYENLGEPYTGQPYPLVKNQGGAQPIPFIGAVFPRGKWAIGVGLVTPSGYGLRRFPRTVQLENGSEAPAPQRYDAVGQESQIAAPSVAVAVAVSPRLRLGARLGWGFATISTEKYVQGLSSPGEEPGKDSLSRVKAVDRFVPSFSAGLHYRIIENVDFGASWSAPMAIRAVGKSRTELGADLREPAPGIDNKIVPVDPGTERCAPGGTEDALSACLNLDLPMVATVGFRFIAENGAGEDVGDIEVNARWENWSRASDYVAIVDAKNTALDMPLNETVIRHGLRDVYSVRVGGSGRVVRGEREVVVRAGVGYESAAAPETWSRLDVEGAPRFSASGGVGVLVGRYRLDVGIAGVASVTREVRDVELGDNRDTGSRVQPDISVPSSEASMQPYHPHNAGDYRASYLIASLGLTTSF